MALLRFAASSSILTISEQVSEFSPPLNDSSAKAAAEAAAAEALAAAVTAEAAAEAAVAEALVIEAPPTAHSASSEFGRGDESGVGEWIATR